MMLEEWIKIENKDAIAEGQAKGRAEGRAEEQNRYSSLILHLAKDGRNEGMKKSL